MDCQGRDVDLPWKPRGSYTCHVLPWNGNRRECPIEDTAGLEAQASGVEQLYAAGPTAEQPRRTDWPDEALEPRLAAQALDQDARAACGKENRLHGCQGCISVAK